MTAHVLICGQIFRAPEQRTGKNGHPYATATIKVGHNGETTFWRVVAFNENAVASLMELSEGDGVSCAGTFKAELYQPEGKPARVNLSLVADQVVSARAAKNAAARERRQEQRAAPREQPRPPGQPSDYRARQGRLRDDSPPPF